MKKMEDIIRQFESKTIDGRDISRLSMFMTQDQLKKMGYNADKNEPLPLTKENILRQLEKDVDFGFEKALNKRGISSSLMFEVVRMWNWILEDGLESWREDQYAMYGLPLFKETAIKYGFKNRIGIHIGDEWQFNDPNYYFDEESERFIKY